ncbi:MAG: amidase [Ruminococcaceae bacterium]|nr:amidase [Oscillospiraceae bacterium]
MAVTFKALAKKNNCYKAAQKMPKGKAEGIVVHSTGANNPNLKRYVNSPAICGENKYKNYYDRPNYEACPHAVIGKDKNGEVRAAQLLPYDICCWNCGRGSKGSYNYEPAYLQFEICEDALNNEEYFNAAFDLAAKLCREWCDKYGVPVEKIVSHKEAHKLGYASNHGDPENWLSKFGKNMDWFRAKVEELGKPPKKLYRVQIGAFLTKKNAEKCKVEAAKCGYSAFIVKSGLFYRVQVGAFEDYEKAEARMVKLKVDGFKAFVVEATE